jgi:deoxyribonuclease-4
MNRPPLGAHTSTSGGIFNTILEGKAIRADVVQIFSKNQRQWVGKAYADEDLTKFFMSIDETGVIPVMIHTSYLINLCSPKVDIESKSKEALIDELKRAHTLKIPYVVQHPGSHLNTGEMAGIKKIAENIKICFDNSNVDDVMLLLETTAGQGTNLGYKFEHLRDIIDQSGVEDKLGVCFDTCHVFAAGYDIRTKKNWQSTMNKFDKIIGIAKLKGFHFNDSLNEFGSRKDRHERIGKGKIGSQAFKHIMQDARLKKLSMILEIPGGTEAYAKDLKVLRKLLK